MIVKFRRVQYPVGQGGFHSCTIKNENTEDNPFSESVFEYVYDCGTYSLSPDGESRAQHIQAHIEQYESIDGKVDLFFLSHLDADHYNGAEQLCRNKVVARIILPYFTVEEICLALLHKSIERVVPQTPDGFTAWSPLRSWACPSA